MKILKEVDDSLIETASQALLGGNLVAFPTETVYGLGADALNNTAVKRLYEVKGRPNNHPVIVHISSIDLLGNWVTDIPEIAYVLANEFWPGPLTIILKKSNIASDLITGGQNTVAIRIPNHPIAQSLLQSFESKGGLGIVAPSANRFGAVSPTRAQHVLKDLNYYLNDFDLLLDGGTCEIGIESTIVALNDDEFKVLRPGLISNKQILKALDKANIKAKETKKELGIQVSGKLLNHYQPKARVILNGEVLPGDGFIALKSEPTPDKTIRLCEPSDDLTFAKVLYESLRNADQLNLERVLIKYHVNSELGSALMDRIIKSSTKNN